MQTELKAVIFDMDGVIINSEPLWRKAMIKGFNQFGMPISEEDCRKTMGRRINEVIDFWLKYHAINKFSIPEIETVIMTILIEMIEQEGALIYGVLDVLKFCKAQKLKIGLATSSSQKLMYTVLNKLSLTNYFDATISAENLKYGKPHPEVFLICAESLNIHPFNCIVIEDSVTGAIAAKAAQMPLIVVPDPETKHQEKFVIADYHLNNMIEVLTLLKKYKV